MRVLEQTHGTAPAGQPTWRTGEALDLCRVGQQVLAQAQPPEPGQRQQLGLQLPQPVGGEVQQLRQRQWAKALCPLVRAALPRRPGERSLQSAP